MPSPEYGAVSSASLIPCTFLNTLHSTHHPYGEWTRPLTVPQGHAVVAMKFWHS
jgi:hypothetical protein